MVAVVLARLRFADEPTAVRAMRSGLFGVFGDAASMATGRNGAVRAAAAEGEECVPLAVLVLAAAALSLGSGLYGEVCSMVRASMDRASASVGPADIVPAERAARSGERDGRRVEKGVRKWRERLEKEERERDERGGGVHKGIRKWRERGWRKRIRESEERQEGRGGKRE